MSKNETKSEFKYSKVFPLTPAVDFRQRKDEILSKVAEFLESGIYIGGVEVTEFEKELAEWLGSKHVVGAGSGTTALHLALIALELKPGDEVIVPAYTFIATANAVALTGAKPIFVDIDPVTYNIKPESIEAAITQNTKVIIPVHLFGLLADMNAINEVSKKHNLFVLEDAAQALGAKFGDKQSGNFGNATAHSFYPTKNLGAYGDAGALNTDDDEFADKLRKVRNHGSPAKNEYDMLGTNGRLDGLQAALLRLKLPLVKDFIERRRKAAQLYKLVIDGYKVLEEIVTLPVEPENYFHTYNQFVIRVPADKRDDLFARLRENGVFSSIYYNTPLHLEPTYKKLGYEEGQFPESEKAAKETIALPIHPDIEEEQIEYVVRIINEFFNNKKH